MTTTTLAPPLPPAVIPKREPEPWRAVNARASAAKRRGDLEEHRELKAEANTLRFTGLIEEMMAERPALSDEQKMRLVSVILKGGE